MSKFGIRPRLHGKRIYCADILGRLDLILKNEIWVPYYTPLVASNAWYPMYLISLECFHRYF